LLGDAMRLDPFSAWLPAKLAWTHHMAGDADASLTLSRKLMEKFPDNDTTNLYAILILSYNGQAESVLERTRAIAERLPQYDFAASSYAYVLAQAGHAEEALAILDRLHWFSRERFVLNTFNAAVYTALGDRDSAIRELQIANENRCPWFFLMLADPRLASLRGDPEFEAMRSILPAMEAGAEKQPAAEDSSFKPEIY
jgi:tetratricopeptide (TPR) repeat protein